MGTSPDPIAALDDLLHAKARLGIMTVVTTLGGADFATLKRELGLTDGNLGAHLRVLEDAGYIDVVKAFVERKPRTTISPTPAGRRAFNRYLEQLEAVIRQARKRRL
jgi:DNA-binding MarR family transcriptional regulator